LSDSKVALLTGRLSSRLRLLGYNSFNDYYRHVVSDQTERVHMLDAISTNETHFFREPSHFQFLSGHVFPRWQAQAATGQRSRHIRVWSAGCSTGQEPYSLAMVLRDRFSPLDGWVVEILATDLSMRALSVAERGIWQANKTNEIPPHYRNAFLLKGQNGLEGKCKIVPEIRSMVRFFRLNLNDSSYPLNGTFDLIFCRNVLIYFDQENRFSVFRRVLNFLSPAGYLFLGHSESLHTMHPLLTVRPTIYALAGKTPKNRHAGQF